MFDFCFCFGGESAASLSGPEELAHAHEFQFMGFHAHPCSISIHHSVQKVNPLFGMKNPAKSRKRMFLTLKFAYVLDFLRQGSVFAVFREHLFDSFNYYANALFLPRPNLQKIFSEIWFRRCFPAGLQQNAVTLPMPDLRSSGGLCGRSVTSEHEQSKMPQSGAFSGTAPDAGCPRGHLLPINGQKASRRRGTT